MPTVAAFTGAVVLKKFHRIAAFWTPGLKNGISIPISTVLPWTLHKLTPLHVRFTPGALYPALPHDTLYLSDFFSLDKKTKEKSKETP